VIALSVLTVISWVLLGIAGWIDLKKLVLPDLLIIPAGILALAKHVVAFGWSDFLPLVWGLVPGAFFALIAVLSPFLLKREGMGWGDVKLVIVLGLLSGLSRTVIAVEIASLTALITLVLLVKFGKKRFSDPVPFGFYIVIAGLMTVICVPSEVRLF
jgi:leader peptidase (prepilin peptidase)/N-methyltransferase